MSTIHIAQDFSQTPGGRLREMGPKSGEEFRNLLIKALRQRPDEVVEVVLDGVEGYGSSFLEEAFGGLIRSRLISPKEAIDRVRIIAKSSEYRTYAIEAKQYMLDAVKQVNG